MSRRVANQTKDGWIEVDKEEFFVLYKNGLWAGLTIAKLTDEWAIPFKPVTFHIRFYPQDGTNKDYDIGNAPNLEEAQSLAERYYCEKVLSTTVQFNGG